MKDGFLHSYFLKNNERLIHKWIHYFDIYERHFKRFLNKEILIYEIGVYKGGSAQMWNAYFGDKAKIIGIDINPECAQYSNHYFSVEIGNQADIFFLETLFKKYGTPDIVIDDGSHIMSDIINTFNYLYHLTSKNGLYLIEDTHTSYWDEYGGGLNRKGTIMEFVKDKFDELNAVHTREEIQINSFTKETDSITVYDSVVVFERKPQSKRLAIKTGFLDS